MNRVQVAVIALVAAVLGGLIGAGVERKRGTDDQRVKAAVSFVEAAGLCANSLRALDDGRLDTQRRILEAEMQAFVERADQKLAVMREPKIGTPIPNLIEGVKRARQYAETKGNQDLVSSCDRVVAALQRGTRA